MKQINLAIALLLASGLQAGLHASTLTFEELGTAMAVPLGGIQVGGVRFVFTPAYEASYNGVLGPGTINLSDPVLEGDTRGTLTLFFSDPTPILGFDIALLTLADVPRNSPGPAYTVEGFNGVTRIFSRARATAAQFVYSEDRFGYAGSAIERASISFYSGQDPFGSPGDTVRRFALDNLTFGTSTAPEPPAALLLGGALAFLAGVCRKRRWA